MTVVSPAGTVPVSDRAAASAIPAPTRNPTPRASAEVQTVLDAVRRMPRGEAALVVAGGLVLAGAAAVAAPAVVGAGTAAAAEGAAAASSAAALAESGAALGEGAAALTADGAAADRAVAVVGEAGEAAANVLARGRAYVGAVARDFSAEYRAAAARFGALRYADPKDVGRALGRQAWAATEEGARGAVVAAGMAVGAEAVHRAAGALAHAVPRFAAPAPAADETR